MGCRHPCGALVLYSVQENLRRGGLTPALAPSMPVITEDVVQANRGRKCDNIAAVVLPRGTYMKNKSCLNEEKENTGGKQVQ